MSATSAPARRQAWAISRSQFVPFPVRIIAFTVLGIVVSSEIQGLLPGVLERRRFFRPSRPRKRTIGASVTTPMFPIGQPARAAVNASSASAAIVTTNRLWDSEKRISSSRAMSSRGTRARSASMPRPPAKAHSARATASPPSEQSWQEATSPAAMASASFS